MPGSERVHEISRYALLPAGKLLRPVLLLESAVAVGGDGQVVVPAAVGVEYLHVASLIHDDIIDGDDLRRGRPSVPARYGTADAIVTGDSLILRMFGAVTECAELGVPAARVVEAIKALAEAGIDLCRGQALEAELLGDVRCGRSRYLTVMALKTGALFRGACRSGAVLAGGTPERTRAVVRFAEHLGLAFQMHDDMLAYVGDGRVTGKPGTSDVANRRPTFPVLVAYEAGGARDRERIEKALAGDMADEAAYGLMREVFEATGAVAMARREAERQVALAKEALGDLPESTSSVLMARIADLAITRDR
ncbi:polyprenyl synthetase family protein [Spirillospora sp. CA-294931]|uniref:polyprenyl synthetase family protein n=1 Tax=Spirillospora sp. CA-294931 TaxID=3240042 RepID=UPI003D8BBD89